MVPVAEGQRELVTHEFPRVRDVMAKVEEEGHDRTMAMLDRGLEIIQWATENRITLRAEHLEKMCAAYFMATDVDPREVVLVEDQLGGTMEHGMRTVWYFARKEDVEGMSL